LTARLATSKPQSTQLAPTFRQPAANPTYRKVNPADAPIMILGLTSDKYGPDKLYDEASTVIQQKLSQIQGVGQVNAGGGALPSVRVEVNPTKLSSFGLTMADVQSVLRLQKLSSGQRTNHGWCNQRGYSCQRPNLARRRL